MARTYWNVYIKNSGGSWVLDTTIPRPNDALNFSMMSTQERIKLIDGSNAFYTPTTKYNDEDVSFIWYEDEDGSIKDQIEEYISDNEYLKIVDHNSANYIGKFTSLRSVWLSGVTDRYDLDATFTFIPE